MENITLVAIVVISSMLMMILALVAGIIGLKVRNMAEAAGYWGIVHMDEEFLALARTRAVWASRWDATFVVLTVVSFTALGVGVMLERYMA